jgi:hypothetical protein
MTVYTIILILIACVGSALLAENMSSAFRTIDITELPVSHGDLFASRCKRWNRWNLARKFSQYLGQIQVRTDTGADSTLDSVEGLVSNSI